MINRRGWAAVLNLHAAGMVWGIVTKGLGIMLPAMEDDFVSFTWVLGWIFAMIAGVGDVLGLLAGPLEAKFGTRTVVMTCGFFISISLMLASFAGTTIQLAIPLLLLAGPGIAFTNILTRAAVGRLFTSHNATANGIGHAGTPLALIVFAPLTQFFLDTYGWRGTMMLLGSICMNLVVCGAFLENKRKSSSLTALSDDNKAGRQQDNTVTGKCCGMLERPCRFFKDNLTVDVFHEMPFWTLVIVFISHNFVNDQWVVYFVSHALAKGFTAQDAVTFTALAGVGHLVSTSVYGPLIDRGWVSLRAAMAAFIALAGACLLVDPWMNTKWMMGTNAFMFFALSGINSSLNDVYTKYLFGTDVLVSAFSWVGVMSGFVNISLGFLTGWIHSATGSYDLAFVVLGVIRCLGLGAILAEWLMHRRDYIVM